jgi:uncharacterized membrane protein YgcG
MNIGEPRPPPIPSEKQEEDPETMNPGCCGMPSWASYLWSPFKTVAQDPKETAIVFSLSCFLFGTIGKLCSILSSYITWYGVFGVFLFAIWCLILFAARALAFPGHLSLVKRQLENEVTKRASTYHADAVTASSHLLQLKETDNTLHFINQLKIISFHIDNNLIVAQQILVRVKHQNLLSSTGATYLDALDDYLQLYQTYLKPEVDDLLSTAVDLISNVSKASLISSIESKRNLMARQLQTLVELRSTLHHVEEEEEDEEAPEEEKRDNVEHGVNGGDDDGGGGGGGGRGGGRHGNENSSHWLMKLVRRAKEFIGSWRAARAPLDTVINMAYLRYELIERYNAVDGWLGNNNVDSLYFPPRTTANAQQQQAKPHETKHSTATTTATAMPGQAPSKIVIMCFPNAGILEFVHYQSDWLPFYLSNNFAVVMFNYKGYGLNRFGSPSPSAIKEDSYAVLEKLVALYPSAKIMVHGESMGGMVACSLASKYPLHVSLAYVDRTFSDLPKVGSTMLKLDFVNTYGPYILPWKTDNVKSWLNIECTYVLPRFNNNKKRTGPNIKHQRNSSMY